MDLEKYTFLNEYHPTKKFLGCTTHLKSYKHNIFPGLNLNLESDFLDVDVEATLEFYQPYPISFGLPLPCISTEYVINRMKPGVDLCKEFVNNKLKWMDKKNKMFTLAASVTNPRDLKRYKKLLKDDDYKNFQLPYGVARLTEHLANDPDEYFYGTYNWYYGNTLAKIIFNNRNYFGHAGGENLDELYISEINENKAGNGIPEIKPIVRYKLPSEGPIYDIVSSEGNNNLIYIRQRNVCSAYEIDCDESNDIIIKLIDSVRSKYRPITGMSSQNSELFMIFTDGCVRLTDIDNPEKPIRKMKLPKNDTNKCDNFYQIKCSSDLSTFTVIDRQKIYLFDKRNDSKKPCQEWDTVNNIEMCELLSLLIPSYEKRWYVGSTHSCLLLDTRMGITRKWTHMLTHTPSIGCRFTFEKSNTDVEGLIIGSQYGDEMMSIYNCYGNKNNCTFFPSRIPNRSETLQESCVVGLLTNSILQKRFHFSSIGISSCVDHKQGQIGIYSSFSNGDIFHQSANIENDETIINPTKLNSHHEIYLEEWEKNYNVNFNFNKHKFFTTRSVNMSEMVESLKEEVKIPEKVCNPSYLMTAKWKLSRKYLKSCVDVLASPVLKCYYENGEIEDSAWETDADCREEERSKTVIKSSPVSNRISSWLDEEKGCTDTILYESQEHNEYILPDLLQRPLSSPSKINTQLEPDISLQEISNIADDKVKSKSCRHQSQSNDRNSIVEVDYLIPPEFYVTKSEECSKRKKRRSSLKQRN